MLCSSYSGSTEETLACFAAAEAVGATPHRRDDRRPARRAGPRRRASRWSASRSGLQPRAAVGYLFTIAARSRRRGRRRAPAIHTEIDAAAAWLEQSPGPLVARAGEIAAELDGSIPVIYGSDLTAPGPYRWKTQVNENAKQPPSSAELPEMDHNEIVGWDAGRDAGRFSAIFLQDSDQHPREHERVEMTAEADRPAAQAVLRIDTEGETRTRACCGR